MPSKEHKIQSKMYSLCVGILGNIGHKMCHSCGNAMPFNSFNVSRKGKFGLDQMCRNCKSNQNKILAEKYKNTKDKYRIAKNYSKTHGREFSISYDDYEKLINSGCFYCGTTLSNKAGISIDRVDNNKGYSLENSLPCCQWCNYLRGDRLTVRETQVAVKAVMELRKNEIP